MPTYDYKCLNCGHSFEFFQKINDTNLEICPQCKGKLKRLIGTGGGLIFKGSGFYATDYKKTNSSAQRKESKGADKGAKGDKPCSGSEKNPSCQGCPQAKNKDRE